MIPNKSFDTQYIFMLFFLVYNKSDPRPFSFSPLRPPVSSPRRFDFSTCKRSDAVPALPFCPSPVFSCSYRLSLSTPRKTSFLFSTAYRLPSSQPLSFDIHASDGGCRGSASRFSPQTTYLQHLTSAFSHSCELFCVHQKLNSFIFKRFRTPLPKHPGVGGTPRSLPPHFHASLHPPTLCYTTRFLPGEPTAVSEKKKPAKLFPMFLKLTGRPCLVVGAGTIAESKIASLMEAAAQVRVVAPEATPQVRSWTQSKRIHWEQRGFQPDDLNGMFLVVAATSSTELHEQIFQEATRRGVLCNIVDVSELCDFYYPAVVQRGALQIAISTAGQSPALAQRLRKKLEDQFGLEYGLWLEYLGEARDKLLSERLSPDERKRRLHGLASEQAFQSFRRTRKGQQSKKE
jgi:precorrin-2 dehydrogenase / sirohydrochlorin ferrochelatase